MLKQRKLANARFMKAHLAKLRAIRAYHLSVHHRKIAYKKRAWAIARKLHLIKLAKHAVIMAHRAMGRANHMKKRRALEGFKPLSSRKFTMRGWFNKVSNDS
jgi:hypothetical protein